MLPKPRGAGDAVQLAKLLDVLEQDCKLEQGRTAILPVATERPAALFGMDAYADATPRLAGITWGAEDLSAAVGASASRDTDGNWFAPYQLARSLCLFAAAAAGVPAIDTVYTDYKDAAPARYWSTASAHSMSRSASMASTSMLPHRIGQNRRAPVSSFR